MTVHSAAIFRRLLVAAGLFVLAAPGKVRAQSYVATDLGVLPGGSGSFPASINNAGTIVGKSYIGTNFVAFEYSNGVMTSLGTLGGDDSEANAINNAGTIVGGGYDAGDQDYSALIDRNGTTQLFPVGYENNAQANGINNSGVIAGWAAVPGSVHAFRYSTSSQDLGTLGGIASEGFALNDSGVVVGWSNPPGNTVEHAFVYSGAGPMVDLGTFGGDNSHANGINAAGTIVGDAQTAGDAAQHAFSYSGGVMTDLGTLGGLSSSAGGINSTGVIVGSSQNASSVYLAFVYRNGQMFDLNTLTNLPGVTLGSANAINDSGQIIAYSYANEHGYLLNPISPTLVTHFSVTAPGSATPGAPVTVSITALNYYDNVAPGYAGTVHFTSSDGAAVLPADSSLANGTGNFAVTFNSVGYQTVTATDSTTSAITGVSGTVTVGSPATHFSISAPASANPGAPVMVTVAALNSSNSPVPGYSGTVHFTSSDGAASLPADQPLSGGTAILSVTFNTVGLQTVTATDTVRSALTGISANIIVGNPATHFNVSAPATANAGSSFTVTVTALNSANSVVTGYSGTVQLTSSDGAASLPAGSLLSAGTGAFAVVLNTPGAQTVRATDSVTSSLTGVSPAISVVPIFTTEPANQSTNPGGSATFSVQVTGVGETYQWTFDGQPITGATSSSYTVTDATSANVGAYAVTVTSAAGPATSNGATLTLNSGEGGGETFNGPTIATQPGPLYANLLSFLDGGAYPAFNLIADANGTLYGVTSGNNGTVFKLSPDGTQFTVLHTFSSLDVNGANAEGAYPDGALVLSADGTTLYGTAIQGGAHGSGTVFAIRTAQTDGSGGGPNVAVLHAFSAENLSGFNSDGEYPECNLALGSGGTLFGTTSAGGTHGDGTAFAVSATGSDVSGGAQNVVVLHEFAGGANDGAVPEAGLTLTGNTLYGVASEGGAQGTGAVFAVAANAADAGGSPNVAILHSFAAAADNGNNADGTYPDSPLILATAGPAAGTLIGVTPTGGPNGTGTIFSVQAGGHDGASPNVIVNHSFSALDDNNDNSDGAEPAGPLLLGADNVTLYGEASMGGVNATGTYFTLSAAASDGTAPAAPNISALFSFGAMPGTGINSGGASPSGGLIRSGSNLVGVASEGGANGRGVVFELAPSGTGETAVHTFSGVQDGTGSVTFLLLNGSTLYGASPSGGLGAGVVFKVQTDGSGLTILHTFSALNGATNADGADPVGLALSADGSTLYGFATEGGSNAGGTAFSVATGQTDASGTEPNVSVLHAFAPATIGDGWGPVGAPVLNGATIYGASQRGGSAGLGTVFSFQASLHDTGGSPNVSVLHAFQGGQTDGAVPLAGLVLGGTTLYGATQTGGMSGQGTVYSVDSQGHDGAASNVSLLHSFSGGGDGAAPAAPLILNGTTLYGTAAGGGQLGNGTVFSVQIGRADGSSPNVVALHAFANGLDGASPSNGLILSGGTLYGATTSGGIYGAGIVFAVNPAQTDGGDGPNVVNLHTFSGVVADGANPGSSLVAGQNGWLYGSAGQGGASGQGVIFALNPATIHLITPGGNSSLTFSVTATDVLNDSYQWYLNEQPVAGATHSTLSLTNIAPANAGNYTVAVTDGTGTTDSNAAVVSFLSAPAITTQPQGVTVGLGGTATLTVAATGSGDTYTWYRNGTALSDGAGISGTATATLVLGSVSSLAAGGYYVTVGNPGGSVTSNTAQVTVISQSPSIGTEPTNQWAVVGNSASFSVGASGPSLGYRWYEGAPGSGQPLSDGLGVTGSSTATLSLSGVAQSASGSYYVLVTNPAGTATSTAAALQVYLPGQIISGPTNLTAGPGDTAAFTVLVAGTNSQVGWAFNGTGLGQNFGTVNPVSQTNDTAHDTTIGVLTLTTYVLEGMQRSEYSVRPSNTVTAYADPPDSTTTLSQASATATLTITAPVITTPLTDASIYFGNAATFTVGTASSTDGVEALWSLNGVPLFDGQSGGLVSTLLQSVSGLNPGSFTASVVDNSTVLSSPATISVSLTYFGAASSSLATLTILPITITPPASQSVGADGTVSFSTAASGGANVFTWSLNGVALADGTPSNPAQYFPAGTGQPAPSFTVEGSESGTLTLSGLQNLPATSTISVTAADEIGSASASATLSFANTGPVIETEPTNQSAAAGGGAAFTVAATGAGTLTYQWFLNGTPLSDGNGISGTTGPTLSLSRITPSEGGAYTVGVSNGGGTLYSSPASLTTVSILSGQVGAGSSLGSVGTDAHTTDAAAGSFTLYLRADGTAVLLAYIGSSQTGYLADVTVAADGSFSAPSTELDTSTAGPVFQGQIVNGVLSGSAGSLGALSGSEVAATGQNPAGFYEAAATGANSGTAYVISEPNGQAFVLIAVGSTVVAGTGTVQADGSVAVTSAGADQIAGTISAASGEISLTAGSAGGSAMTFAGLSEVVAPVQELLNGSAGGVVGAGVNSLSEGFVVAGNGPAQVLVRAAGPTLSAFGLTGVLSQPVITLYQGSAAVASNQGWSTSSNAAAIAQAAASSGAFAFAPGSADSAILTTLAPGAYSAVITGANGSTGLGLVEVYNLTPTSSGSPQLVNESTRGLAGSGGQVLTQGIVVGGNEPVTVLIRGIGPGLTPYGVPNAAASVQLSVFQGQTLLAQNSGWNGNPVVAAEAALAGAFALAPTSADAALVLTLNPGDYTIQASGANGATGQVMIEAYEVPP